MTRPCVPVACAGTAVGVGDTVDGVSPDEAVASATLASIRELCSQRPTIYLPSHDPKSAERLHERRAATVRGSEFTASLI